MVFVPSPVGGALVRFNPTFSFNGSWLCHGRKGNLHGISVVFLPSCVTVLFPLLTNPPGSKGWCIVGELRNMKERATPEKDTVQKDARSMHLKG